MIWIKDEDFIRDKVPMTKFNVRMLSIGYLELMENTKLLDIGSGTGSVSIQAALHGAKVWALEQKEMGMDLLKKNGEKFGVTVSGIHGHAPEDLPTDQVFQRVFVGGSGGCLKEIFSYMEDHLESQGIVVANFILPENLVTCKELLKLYDYRNVEVHLIQSASMDHLGLMRGENPIYLVKGVKP